MRSLRLRGLRIAALYVFTSLAVPLLFHAHAQYGTWVNPYTGGMWNNPGSSLIDTMLQGRIWTSGGGSGSGGGQDTSTAPSTTTVAAANASSFQPIPQRLELAAFVDSLTPNKDEQAVFFQALNEGITLFEEAARGAGRPNNVAMAVAYMIAANYSVYTGGLDVSEEAFDTLWRAVNQMYAESPDFARSSHRDRQSLYETAVMYATLPLMGYQQALEENDASSANMYRQFSAQVLRSVLGMEPDRIEFTATGVLLGD